MTKRTRNHRVRRIALRVVVFLLLGAIVNVAVAWGIAWRVRFTDIPSSIGRMKLSTSVASFAMFERIGASRLVAQFWNPADAPDYYAPAVPPCWGLPTISSIDAKISQLDLSDAVLGTLGEYPVDAAGFPFRCLSCWWEEGWVLRDGIPLREEQFGWVEQGGSALPLHPIWPGFAINTIFYATILWLLFAFPFTLRRKRRIKRGLCPKCAYPQGTSDVCTECGEEIHHRGTESTEGRN